MFVHQLIADLAEVTVRFGPGCGHGIVNELAAAEIEVFGLDLEQRRPRIQLQRTAGGIAVGVRHADGGVIGLVELEAVVSDVPSRRGRR